MISLLRPECVPVDAVCRKTRETITGLDGQEMTLTKKVDLWIKRSGNQLKYKRKQTNSCVCITFLISSRINCSILSYYDIAKLDIIVSEGKAMLRNSDLGGNNESS